MHSKEIYKALETAISGEKHSLKTYLEFAYQTRDESGKNMFIRLALDEFSHIQILETQREVYQEKECFMPIKIAPSEIEKLIPVIKEKSARVKGLEGLDQMNALRTALALEDRAIKFYQEQAEITEDPEARMMYERLKEMEQAHYELIQAEIDYIEKTGFWFNLQEFSLELE
jgi:rubrerythrin